MAGWDRNTDWNRDVLERIVALLFALANLADLAAGAPFLRRRQVLEILSHGEAEARAFVIGMAFGAPAPESLAQNSSGRGENDDFENRSGAYMEVREHRKRRNRHLQPVLASFRSGSEEAPGEADDAAGLAIRLRALALMLCLLLARAGQSALPGATGPRAGRRKPAGRVGRRAPPLAPDTS